MGAGALSCADQNNRSVRVIGIVTALRAEAACITSAHVPLGENFQINNHLALWLSGMGAQAAQTAAQGLHQRGVTGLISFGVAGALDDHLNPGDLVLPDAIQANERLPVDCAWRDRLQQRLPAEITVVNGLLADSAIPLTGETAKRSLAQATGAIAVDMESAAVAQVAASAGIPFIAVRAIIDPVRFSPPEALLGAVYPDGGVNPLRLMALLLNRSVNVGTLLQMGAGMRKARKTLSQIIQAAGTDPASQTTIG